MPDSRPPPLGAVAGWIASPSAHRHCQCRSGWADAAIPNRAACNFRERAACRCACASSHASQEELSWLQQRHCIAPSAGRRRLQNRHCRTGPRRLSCQSAKCKIAYPKWSCSTTKRAAPTTSSDCSRHCDACLWREARSMSRYRAVACHHGHDPCCIQHSTKLICKDRQTQISMVANSWPQNPQAMNGAARCSPHRSTAPIPGCGLCCRWRQARLPVSANG